MIYTPLPHRRTDPETPLRLIEDPEDDEDVIVDDNSVCSSNGPEQPIAPASPPSDPQPSTSPKSTTGGASSAPSPQATPPSHFPQALFSPFSSDRSVTRRLVILLDYVKYRSNPRYDSLTSALTFAVD
ncbi:unnamed protein product [Nezara viridula]|uniref:Uncharacterized protein n=1 Tax=Nezara viridula TaxID=85310 RepID=A0A9P0HPS3_NEZVI|nr:unnamed protein product [Nezara viridula]